MIEMKLEAGHQCYHEALKITARYLHLAKEAWRLEWLEVGSRKQECLPQPCKFEVVRKRQLPAF